MDPCITSVLVVLLGYASLLAVRSVDRARLRRHIESLGHEYVDVTFHLFGHAVRFFDRDGNLHEGIAMINLWGGFDVFGDRIIRDARLMADEPDELNARPVDTNIKRVDDNIKP